MVTNRLERTHKAEAKRRKRLLRLAGAILGGIAVGYFCPMLPLDYQKICHWGARVIAFLVGGV